MVNLLYLLDANVLIDADRDYYPIDRVPEFWNRLAVMAELGQIRNYPSTTPGAESTLDSVVSRLIFVSIVDVTPVPRKFPLTGPAKRGVADAATAM